MPTIEQMRSRMTETTRETARRALGPRMSRRMEERRHRRANLGRLERAASTGLGAAMAGLGLSLLTGGRGAKSSGVAMTALGAFLAYRGATGYCPGYAAMGVESDDATKTSQPLTRSIHVRHSVSVNCSPEEVYGFWRDLSNLPRVMSHLESIEVTDEAHSRWQVRGPAGRHVAWTAVIVDDEPQQRIAWRSQEGAEVDNHGEVRFRSAPEGRGTIVEVELTYHPPAGVVGALVARAFGEAPEQQIQEDMRRFKSVIEAGEFPTTQGQPRGRCA
ncbi:MAG: SRPBCC family protein [Phycisphaeraceae bacterium]